MVKVNSEWNHHFIAGLVGGGNTKMRASEYLGDRTDFMVRTNVSFLNGLVSLFTFSIYTPTTTTYYIPLDGYQEKKSDWDIKYSHPQQQNSYPAQQQSGYVPQQQNSYPAQQQNGYVPQQQNNYPAQQQNGYSSQQQSVNSLQMQSNQEYNRRLDLITLRDGNVIKGHILEQIPDRTIKIKLQNGNIYTYNMSDVVNISKDGGLDSSKYY